MGARLALPVVAVLLVGLTTGCTPRDPVDDYADAAIAAMDPGLYADTQEFRDAVAASTPRLYAAATIADTYSILSGLVQIAGGPHSRFLSPSEMQQNADAFSPDADFEVPTASTADGVTVLTVPSFDGQDPESVERYRAAGVQAVEDAQDATTCGWVIGLSGNGGGNAWPMLMTVAPLLDDGRVAGFERRDGTTSWITVDAGRVQFEGGDVGPGAGVTIRQPVAIVTSGTTASAAELVALAFQGQPDAVRIGTPTYGFTTGNEVITLSDGAAEVLTTSRDVDRTGQSYDGPLEPDVAVAPGASVGAVETAVQRLRDGCS